MKRALIFWGGWLGHEPEQQAIRFQKILQNHDFEVSVCQGTECLNEKEKLADYDLMIPLTTMAEISSEQCKNITEAVAHGVGLAGCHGGMCDAFRQNTNWQFMTGGQWVSHPGGDGIEYTVHICHGSSPIVEGLKDFTVCSEQYYLHIDPAVEVLATTRFPLVNYYHCSNKPVDMPVAWTKYWGIGRVFYCSLGHHDDVFDKFPTAQVLMERGMLWASEGKAFAQKNGLDASIYENSAKMY